jgi:anti-sigma regulatory factor (Ser/Thr protein kinase)
MGAEAWSLEPVESATVLRPDPQAPRLARSFLWSTAARATLPPDMETVTLVASEVVSNAVRHGAFDAPISLACRVEGETVRTAVRNRGPRFDPADAAGAGNGLRLVAGLSRRWGARPIEGGMEVWFEV